MSAPAARRPTQRTLEILERLVAFPTVSRDSNLALIHWVRDYLAGFGIESRLTHDAGGGKANLFATIGAGGGGGLVLSGHSDVVPVEGQVWASDPFTLSERNGKLHGRGTADMKGFLAAVLASVPRFLASGVNHPLHIAISHDEEVGCLGVRHLLADLAAAGIRPAGCIVGEPTGMKPVIGHKSSSVYVCSVEGLEAHSSLAPQGVNAIDYASRLIARIGAMAERLRAQEPPHEGYEVPFSTMQVGVIEGGQAHNIVPRHCSFCFDVRALPSTDPEALAQELRAHAEAELLPAMRALAPHAGITIERRSFIPGAAIDEDAPLTRYVQRLARSNAPPGFVPYGTEAGLFQQQGIAALICGPGSISQAHRPDEYIALDQLAECEDFLARLAETPFDARAD